VTTANAGTPHPSTTRSGRPGFLRALWQSLVAAGAAATLLAGVTASPAQAHVPIVLLVMAPQDGQTVDPNPQIDIYAQRTLGGVDQVAYTLTLDQRPIDPASGRISAARPTPIRAGQHAHVPLHDLAPGQHRLELRYRPDNDEPVMGDTVAFTVRAPGAPTKRTMIVAIGVALAAVAAATGWWARRHGRRNVTRPARGAVGGPAGEQEPHIAEQADLRSRDSARNSVDQGI
jgi:hypothetical protein